jgi:hypothetical protein
MPPSKRQSAFETPAFINLDQMAEKVDRSTVHLFTLNDTEYRIPAEPSAALTLRYLRMVQTQGQETAGAWLLEGMLGAEAYEALMSYDGLTMGMLSAVMAAVQKHVAGASERVAGIGGPLD